MKYNPKHGFTKVLRELKLPHITSKDYVKIQNVSIDFFHDFDTIKFQDNRLPEITFVFPFSSPHTILFKYRWYVRYINKILSKNRLSYEQKLIRSDCPNEKTGYRLAS